MNHLQSVLECTISKHFSYNEKDGDRLEGALRLKSLSLSDLLIKVCFKDWVRFLGHLWLNNPYWISWNIIDVKLSNEAIRMIGHFGVGVSIECSSCLFDNKDF